MRISINWLKKYVDLKISTEEIAERLTMAGLEVESINRPGDKFENFVVGELLDLQKHPKADRLTVCKVNIGTEILQVVCGAPNVARGQKVPVARVGAVILRNQHDPEGKPFTITDVKLRGVDSFGMICSQYELDAGEDKDGILVLKPEAEVGMPLARYFGLNDTLVEIGVTPNRPDALSHIGVAREVAAILNVQLMKPEVTFAESSKNIESFAKVVVEDPENCPRYTARVLFNVTVAPSPDWMQEILVSLGIRPINNIVDITNYVLMECGQPLHAFDYDKLRGGKIIVKKAQPGESFITLDHKSRILQEDTLMICDGERNVAIAGVMGGEESEISEKTRNILVESAYFNPRSIRRTAKYFGLNTDASQRFERGADPGITYWAANRAVQLIQDICGGELLRSAIDIKRGEIKEKEITLRINKTNELLGITLSAERISELLSKIEINAIRHEDRAEQGLTIFFRVPTFRPDIEREIDLIEEVARVYGYGNIEPKTTSSVHFSGSPVEDDYVDRCRQQLIGCGLMEIVVNSMQNVSISSIVSDKYVRIANPISKGMEALRTSLVPGALEVMRDNLHHGSKNLNLFEIGKIYMIDPNGTKTETISDFVEKEQILIIRTGLAQPHYWDEKPRFADIFDVKGMAYGFLQKIFLDNIKFIPYSNTTALSEGGVYIEIKGEYAGTIGTIRKDLLKRFDIEQEIVYAELEIDVLHKHEQKNKKFAALPRFPAVTRDIAVIADDSILLEQIQNEIGLSGKPLLKKAELFDIYIGDQIESGKKSYAFTLEFMSEDHTMTQIEIDDIMNKIITKLELKLNAVLRK